MLKIIRFTCRMVVPLLTLFVIFAGTASAKEKTRAKSGGFDFTRTSAFMKEMETRPDFPVSTVLANDYAYSLHTLGAKIDTKRQSAIIACIRNLQLKNGGFVADKSSKSASILYTDIAMDTLGLLNAANAVDAARVKTFAASLKNPDGGFGFSQEAKKSSLATTYYAVHLLKTINGLDLVDKTRTAGYIKSFEKKEGGFGSVQGVGAADARNTYMAAYILNAIGMLSDTARQNSVKFLGTTPYGGSKSKAMPDLDEQLYAIKALKELKVADKVDRKFAMVFLKKVYVPLNGGFGPIVGYGSTPDSTTTAIRILAEMGRLKPAMMTALR